MPDGSGMETAQTKRCTRCGEVKGLEEFHRWSRGPGGRAYRCKGCNSEQRRKFLSNPANRDREIARKRERWSNPAYRERAYARKRERQADPEVRIRVLACHARGRAQWKGLDFDPDLSDLLPPPTHCPVLGIPIDYSTGRGLRPDSPSIDRIDNSRGYVHGNRIVISRRANTIKNDATVAELRAVADFYARLSAQSPRCG